MATVLSQPSVPLEGYARHCIYHSRIKRRKKKKKKKKKKK